MIAKRMCSLMSVLNPEGSGFPLRSKKHLVSSRRLTAVLGAIALATPIFLLAHPASACTTYISGNIVSDTTWTPAGSPYCVTVDCNVQAGVTLTIEPQVLVYFNTISSGISVSGALIAVGTEANPIIFTSGAGTPAPGDWRGIRIFSTGSADLEYCDLSYGGRDIECGLRIESSNVEVHHCHIHDNTNDGIYFFGSDGLTATIADCQIDNNAASAIRENPGASLRYDRVPSYSNLTFSSNGTDALVVTEGTFNCSRTFDGPASFNGSPILITGGGVNVLSGCTLTLQPGTTIQFAQQYADLIIEGGASLMAEGTEPLPITFTRNEATPAPGDWRGVRLQTTAHSHLSYCDIGYGGQDYGGTLYIESSDVEVRHCRVHHSSTNGLRFFGNNGWTALIADSQFDNNTAAAIVEDPGAALRYDREPTYTNLTFSANGTNALVITEGAFNCNRTFNAPASFNGSPIVFTAGGIDVNNGYTLTLQPGTTIQFAETWGDLNVFGSVVANGTQAQPITFTTDAATPTPGSWRRMFVDSAGSAHLEYCDLGYAGDSVSHCLRVESSNVQLSHCRIHHTLGNGVYIFGGNRTPTFADTQIDHTGGVPIHEDPGASGQYHAAPTYTNLTFSDNGTNALSLSGGGFYCNRTFDGPGSFNGSPILLGGSGIDVTSGYTLTVQPGTTIQFAETWGSLNVVGTLTAEGTAAQPITFTSDATTLQPGSWRHIFVDPAGTVHLEYCDLGYAGDSVSHCLRIESANTQVRHCRIHHTLGDGIYISTVHPAQLENNAITDSTAIGLRLTGGAQVEALHTTLARNGTGIYVGGTATLTNTILTSHTTGVNVEGGSSATMTNTLWYDNTTPIIGTVNETGHLDGAPAFPIFDRDGYHLTAASPAIDAGVATSVTDDIDGDPRPIPASGAPDLGADEYRDALGLIPPATGGTLEFTDPQGNPTTIEVPPGAVSQPTTIIIKAVPTGAPLGGLGVQRSTFNVQGKDVSPMNTAPAGYYFAGHAFDLEAYQNGVLVPNFVFSAPVTVTIHYSDGDVAKSSSRPKLDETTLRLFYWTGSAWDEAACAAYNRHPTDNWLAVPICHLTRFALFAKPHKPWIPLLLR